jgi:DNA-binding transcriptional regulator YhcF (GntR family)
MENIKANFHIDRNLSVSVVAQLRGRIEYGIAFGDIPLGSRLPSVRELSREIGIAPATVAQVYKDLQEKGLLETLTGSGTFVRIDVPRSPHFKHQLLILQELINRLAQTAHEIGLSTSELAQIISVRTGQHSSHPLQLLVIGNFARTAEAYVRDIRRYLHPEDILELCTLDTLRGSKELCERARANSAVLTFADCLANVRELLGQGILILTVPFITAKATRTALAELNPLQRVGLVSTYPDFLLTFKLTVESHAPHIDVFRATVLGADDLPEVLAVCDVIVYTTGAESVLDTVPGMARAFEYSFAPDPRALIQDVLPKLDALRGTKLTEAKGRMG